MAVRAASWVVLGLLYTGAVHATEPLGYAAPGDSSAASTASMPAATDARLGGDETRTRFVMDLTQKVDVRAFTLADPYRVVLDTSQVAFQLPPKIGDTGRGLVKAFRFGLMMVGGSRIVFDVVKPVRIDKAFVVDAANGAPARLVLDLVATDRTSFLRQIAEDAKVARTESPPLNVPSGGSGAGDSRPLVVLDPGHGGPDTGTKAASGEQEKDIVLDFAQRLRERLTKVGKYRVLLTRSDDTFVPLGERVRIARNAGASLFVSIHADSLPTNEGDAQGATIYTLSETATDQDAERLAQEENRADIIAGIDLKDEPDDVAGILLDLAQRETKGYSVQFAHKLADDLKGATRLYKKPLKSAGFRVLRAPDVPSVLIELGYVSNKDDLASLLSDTWRNKTADAVAHAIDGYLGSHVAGPRAGAN